MMALLIAIIVLLSITLIALVVGGLIAFRKLGAVSAEMIKTMQVMRESVAPAARDASRTINNIDTLVNDVRSEVRRIGRVVDAVDRLLEGRTVVAAASRAVASSKTTFVSIIEGLKESLKAMRRAKKESNSNT